jgi:hypothetical protein
MSNMTATDSSEEHSNDEASTQDFWRSTSIFVVLLATVLLAAGLWQWRSPNAFLEQGSTTVTMYTPIGTTANLGLASPRQDMDPAVLTIHAVELQVVKGTASIEVVVCRTGAGKAGIGATRGRIDRDCESHESPEGARLRALDQLVLRVRSDEPARLIVKGVKLTYSHGWRRGSQVTGQTVDVEFGTATVRDHLNSR